MKERMSTMKLVPRVVIAIILSVYGVNRCLAQTKDPYASAVDGYTEEVTRENVKKFLNVVANLSFAAACNVVPEQSIWGIVRQMEFDVIQGARKYINLEGNISTSNKEGKEMATRYGCGYWTKNPDKVVNIRKTIFNFRPTPLH